MQHATRMMAMVAFALTAAGCGSGDGIPRHTVSGNVTLDGKPLEDGQITFTPELAGNPAAGATIKAGAYSLGRSEGPAAGPHLEPPAIDREGAEKSMPVRDRARWRIRLKEVFRDPSSHTTGGTLRIRWFL